MQLLSGGILESLRGRTFLYHRSCPGGQIFQGQEVDDRIAEGWVEAPWLIHENALIPDEPIKRYRRKKGE